MIAPEDEDPWNREWNPPSDDDDAPPDEPRDDWPTHEIGGESGE